MFINIIHKLIVFYYLSLFESVSIEIQKLIKYDNLDSIIYIIEETNKKMKYLNLFNNFKISYNNEIYSKEGLQNYWNYLSSYKNYKPSIISNHLIP